VLALTVSYAYAVPAVGLGLGGGYGGGLALGGGYGGGLALSKGFGGGLALDGGYGGGLALAGGYGAKGLVQHGPAIHPAAIHSTRSYEVVPVALNYEAPIPQTIDVGPNIQPVEIIFRTQSSPLGLQQIHTPAAPEYESTKSEDQPSVLTHESYRPVIQNYREVIQPHRNIEQRVQPVIENVHTVVAKGEEYRAAPVLAAKVLDAPLPLLAKGGY
jgi:hypothetical protein